MTTVVPTSEEDAALSVVRFASQLAWADAGPEVAEPQVSRLCLEAEEFIVMGKWLELASLMVTSAELIFSKVSEKDVESIFTIICNLVTKTENPDEVMEMVKVITAKIIQQPNEKPAVRLKILINLYNLLETPYCQFYVYMKALNLAIDGKVTEYITPSFKKIDSFLKDWKIGIPEQRELFLTLSNILKENKSMSKDAFKFLTNYLATFGGEDAHVLSEAKEVAARAIVEFVRAPDIFQCDLLDWPAVGQLEKDTKYALLYQLLKIFLTQRLGAYLEYHAENSTLLKSYGLVHEECIAKMRLMSLVDLSSDGSGQIPYELIRDTLQINDDEVELWVVRAITAKLIDCKMDQMNQVVVVSHPTYRVFGQHQWQELRTKLVTWRGNITNVISTIQANKTTEDGSQAAQAIEGVSINSVNSASEKVQTIMDETVNSRNLDYSHFISLPLAIHPELVDKLINFQHSILGHSSYTSADLGIDKSIFIKPKTFHLTVLMLKLWNKERIKRASEVLQSISSKVTEALDNRPLSIRLEGLEIMKGSLAKARVLYAPVEEIASEGRLLRACQVIIDAYVEAGLVLENDAKRRLKLHATVMNTRHRERKKWTREVDSFDARGIVKQYGSENWGHYLIREAHLSQRFSFDENGYYHYCASIPFPENMYVE